MTQLYALLCALVFITQTNFCMDKDPTIKEIIWKKSIGKFENDEISYYCTKTPEYCVWANNRSAENQPVYSVNRYIYSKKDASYKYESVRKSDSINEQLFSSETCRQQYQNLEKYYNR